MTKRGQSRRPAWRAAEHRQRRCHEGSEWRRRCGRSNRKDGKGGGMNTGIRLQANKGPHIQVTLGHLRYPGLR